MDRRRRFRIAALVVAAVVPIVLLTTLRAPRDTLLWRAAFNAGHAPLFGMIALAALGLSLTAVRWGQRSLHYVGAFVLTSAAGLATELVQFFGRRDADFWDLLRDLGGAAGFLLVAFALDRNLRAGRKRRVGVAAAGILALLAVWTPLMLVGASYVRRTLAFPTLFDFEQGWERPFVGARYARLQYVPPPEEWTGNPSRRTVKVTFFHSNYPLFMLREPRPDWSGYRRLAGEVYSEAPESMELVFRLMEAGRRSGSDNRFDLRVAIHPGSNSIRLRLDDFGPSRDGRGLDRSNIGNLIVLADHPRWPFVVYLDDFRLEK